MRRRSCFLALLVGYQLALAAEAMAQADRSEDTLSATHLLTPAVTHLLASESDLPQADMLQRDTPGATPIVPSTAPPLRPQFSTFPVGVNLGRRNVVPSTFVRGVEVRDAVVDFAEWLVPFEVVVTALQLRITPLEDGRLEVRSPGVVVQIHPDQLTIDPELGQAISIQAIEQLLGVPSEFDVNEYAISFNPPWLAMGGRGGPRPGPLPVVLEGLPQVSAAPFTLGTVSQEVVVSGTRWDSDFPDDITNYDGNLRAVGTLLGGSWFVRTQQAELDRAQSWRLSEFQYFRPSETTDYVLATQPRFWVNSERDQYWGATAIRRWGYTPPPTSASGAGFNPSQRLQANIVDRTIGGEAPPGTLVQLTQGGRTNVIAETIVDDSGIYRFDQVPTGVGGINSYRILLYPEGRLTATPLEKEARFLNVTGQLPHRASALIVSAGANRRLHQSEDFWGEFTEFQGGVAYRYGVSESLTLGVGTVYQDALRGLGELFYQPNNFPLQVAIAALSNKDNDNVNVNSSISLQPFSGLSLNFNSDSFSERFNLNWRVLPNLSIIADANSRTDLVNAGVQFSLRGPNFFSLARVTANTENEWRWNWDTRLHRFKFGTRGNPTATTSRLSYNLSTGYPTQVSLDIGHSLAIDYATNDSTDDHNYLATIGWRYRSPKQLTDGRYLWDVGVEYGTGSQGSGLIASASTGILPGLALRARYQQISPTSSDDSFRIEVAPILNFQQGIHPDDTRFTDLRSLGGLLIQPFFDANNNGKRDPGEKLYLENPELLLVLNNRAISSFRPDIRRNGLYVRLSPDTYRLDLDPAGYPLDWKAVETAYAVEVVPGSYTPVQIPLILSYSVTGVLTDSEGAAIGGARVEAIPVAGGLRKLSVTNGAGVFFLENLGQGTYELLVNGNPAQPPRLTIDADTPPFQELNLQISPP